MSNVRSAKRHGIFLSMMIIQVFVFEMQNRMNECDRHITSAA